MLTVFVRHITDFVFNFYLLFVSSSNLKWYTVWIDDPAFIQIVEYKQNKFKKQYNNREQNDDNNNFHDNTV